MRDVAAHLVVPHETSVPSFVLAFLAAGGSFDRASVRLTAGMARRPPTELVTALRAHADGRFTPPGFGSEAPLTDMLIHGEDIRVRGPVAALALAMAGRRARVDELEGPGVPRLLGR